MGLNIYEYIALTEETNVEWATQYWNGLITSQTKHQGDCTNHSSPCSLCLMESILVEYRQFTLGLKTNEWVDNEIVPIVDIEMIITPFSIIYNYNESLHTTRDVFLALVGDEIYRCYIEIDEDIFDLMVLINDNDTIINEPAPFEFQDIDYYMLLNKN